MTQEKGIPYQRHKPSAALREFLDPLDPGSYFDCGRARLRGLDDALLAEAKSRGRAIGEDSFQLVATDMGVVYCRPSISFAIAARWDQVTIAKPRGDDPVVLLITWPTHGELKFTVSRRLAGNVFRRWMQLQVPPARPSIAASEIDRRPKPQRTERHEPARPSIADAEDHERAAVVKGRRAGDQQPLIQGKDRVAATVAEAAAVVVKRQRRTAEPDSKSTVAAETALKSRATAEPPVKKRMIDRVGARADDSVNGDGPETWELVAKVAAPVRKGAEQSGKPAKVDRRQNPDALRRKRQEKAGDSRRRRRSARSEPSGGPRSRWFSDLDPVAGSSVPAYDVPPLQSPDPSRPMRPAVKLSSPPAVRSDASPDEDHRVSPTPLAEGRTAPAEEQAAPEPTAEIADAKAVPAAELVDQLLAVDPQPKVRRGPSALPRALKAKPTERPGKRPIADGKPAVMEAASADVDTVPTADIAAETGSLPSYPGAHDGRAEKPPTAAEYDEEIRPAVAAVTGENRTADGEPSLPALLTVPKPPTPEPSWIGSPVSLVAAMVVISTVVLIGAVAVGSYRRSSEVAAGVSPAGPTVSIVDHQRFRPTSDPDQTASQLGQPEASRYSEVTAPPSTIGSGSAPIAQKPEWPPADGPQTCNSNYSGCVPDVGDVDCPNDGDGPIYWPESATVMGEDVYELDTDGDGEICEPDQPPLVAPAEAEAAETGALSPATADE